MDVKSGTKSNQMVPESPAGTITTFVCLAATTRCVSIHSTRRNRFVSQIGLPYLEGSFGIFVRKFLDKRFRRPLERIGEEGYRITIDDSVCELRRNRARVSP